MMKYLRSSILQRWKFHLKTYEIKKVYKFSNPSKKVVEVTLIQESLIINKQYRMHNKFQIMFYYDMCKFC